MTEWIGLLGMLGHRNQDSLPIAENYEGTKQKISVGRINDCISKGQSENCKRETVMYK